MWYAVEYAYGRAVVNNGQRADRVVEFTRRELRDAWVVERSHIPTTNGGSRESLSARHPLVRAAHGLEDGDREGWMAIAEARVDRSAALAPHKAVIWYEWAEAAHAQWVATAPERQIVAWAKAVGQD